MAARRDRVFEVVREVVLDNAPDIDEEDVVDSAAFEDLGLDSLRHVNFMVEIRDRFDAEISSQVAAEMRTVGDVVDWLVRNTDGPEDDRSGSAGP